MGRSLAAILLDDWGLIVEDTYDQFQYYSGSKSLFYLSALTLIEKKVNINGIR